MQYTSRMSSRSSVTRGWTALAVFVAATVAPICMGNPSVLTFERIEESGAPALYTMTLANGLVAVIDSRPGRRTAYCEIGVRVGSRNEPTDLAGISHLLEHLLFKEGETPGARKNPAFSRIRAAGGEVNASTFFERTNYYCDVSSAMFEEGWRGLANLVTVTGFDGKDLETERKVVLEEAALDKSDPMMIAAYSVLRRLFPGDPLAQPVIGFRKTLERIRLEDVDAYYRRHYAPGRAYALVVGDVDPHAAASLLAETIGAWSPAPVPPEGAGRPLSDTPSLEPPAPAPDGFPARPRISDERTFVFRTFTHRVYYGLGVLTDGELGRDRAATDLLLRVLDGGASSRLRRRIVEEEGLTSELLSANFNISNLGLFAAGGGVDPKKSGRFESVLREEFDRLAAEPVSEEELAVAKTLLRSDMVRAFESNAGIAAFRADRLLYGQPLSRDAYLADVLRLTPQQLLDVARVRFSHERLREAEVRPARGFGKVLAALRYLLFRRL